MIYIIYRNDKNNIKYRVNEFCTFMMNMTSQADLFGDIGVYPELLKHAKEHNYNRVTIYQERRCLTDNGNILLEHNIHDDKIYCVNYASLQPNTELFRLSHPTLHDTFLEFLKNISKAMPEYGQTIRAFILSSTIYPHNMFSMPIDEFEKYVNWLGEAFKHIVVNDKTFTVSKPYSIITERLFTIWCMHNYSLSRMKFVHAVAFSKEDGHILDAETGVASENGKTTTTYFKGID